MLLKLINKIFKKKKNRYLPKFFQIYWCSEDLFGERNNDNTYYFGLNEILIDWISAEEKPHIKVFVV